MRLECKFTRAASYQLKLSDLQQLERQAAADELPAFEVEFQGVYPHRRFIIIPDWVYKTLKAEAHKDQE